MALCSVLKSARHDAGLKQIDVAGRLSVTQSYVSKYEAGDRRLDLFELLAVCAVLGVELQDVLIAVEEQLARGNTNETGQPLRGQG